MSELGESVFKAFGFLNDFLKDISKLFTTIEENMGNHGMAAFGDAATFWEHSRAYYAPSKWLPKYIARHYVAKPIGKAKPDLRSQWFVVFVVYLTPEKIQEPMAFWGVGTQAEENDLWDVCNKMGLYHKDGPDFVEMKSAKGWKSPKKLPKQLKSLKYKICPVVELHSAKVVDEVVIQPLLKEISGVSKE